MHGKFFTNICRKRCHTIDIELQIVQSVWLKYHLEHQSYIHVDNVYSSKCALSLLSLLTTGRLAAIPCEMSLKSPHDVNSAVGEVVVVGRSSLVNIHTSLKKLH